MEPTSGEAVRAGLLALVLIVLVFLLVLASLPA
jgi:hypothetical protein